VIDLTFLPATTWENRPVAVEGQVFYCLDQDRLYVWYKNRWAHLESNETVFGRHRRITEPIPPPELIEYALRELIELRRALG
jgi:hypothetical protein